MSSTKGKYILGRLRKGWAVWDRSGGKMLETRDYKAAVRELYRLNGWGEPKNIRQEY